MPKPSQTPALPCSASAKDSPPASRQTSPPKTSAKPSTTSAPSSAKFQLTKSLGISSGISASASSIVKHIAQFTSDIWQIHPFCEGNTRTTAVFIIKYLRSLGFNVNNTTFEKNSWYFRNALVRANYQNLQKGIYKETIHLARYFRYL